LVPIDAAQPHICQAILNHSSNNFSGGQRILNYRVEASEDRAVEHLWVIGRRNQNAVCIIELKKLQKGIQHSPNLSDIIRARPFPTKCINLIEKVYAPRLGQGIEDKSQLRSRLAHEFCYQAVQADDKEGQVEFARQRTCCHGLARSRRADKQESSKRSKAARPQRVLLPLFEDDPVKIHPDIGLEYKIGHSSLRVCDGHEARELAARLSDWYGSVASLQWVPSQ
jgi:hypothetical protein